jgi:alkyl sulfatase BDS1-like metallo-beta-lactamase superfamily hydrolase
MIGKCVPSGKGSAPPVPGDFLLCLQIAEFSTGHVDATLKLPREVWAQIVLKKLAMDKAISSGKAKVSGNREDLTAVFGSFD